MSAIDQLNKVEVILAKATVIICTKLDPKPLLFTMKAEGALTGDDVLRIKAQTTPSEQAEKMLDILIKKPATAYDTFMTALLAGHKTLYDAIKVIEQKHGYVKGTASAPELETAPIGKPIQLGDISDFIGELVTDQLSNVYERLGITHQNVQKAHERAHSNDPDEKAKAVLRFWQEQNGKHATREKLLQALKACKYINAMQNLQEKWGIPTV